MQVALFRFLLILVLACHWLACVWAMTLKIVDARASRHNKHLVQCSYRLESTTFSELVACRGGG